MKDKIDELGRVDAQISARISEIEQLMSAVLTVPISSELPGNRKIVFGKLDTKWRLLVEDGDKKTALLSMPRGFRCSDDLVAGLNRLLDTALDQVQAMLVDRQRINVELERLIERIKKEFG